MRTLLCISVILAAVSTQSCPPQYDLMQGRCIRPLVLNTDTIIIDDQIANYRVECEKDGAHLPIIKNDTENAIFNAIAKSFDEIKGYNMFLLLDLFCNHQNGQLYWVDGTEANYSPHNSIEYWKDCGNWKYTAVSRPKMGDWEEVRTDQPQFEYTVLCEFDGAVMPTTTPRPTLKPTETPAEGQCGDYELMTSTTDATKPCIKAFSNSLSWTQAQTTCAADFGSLSTINSAEENKYIWRTAISNNIVDGMHIGAHQSVDDPNKWTWIDGDIPFDGKTYDNFASFFPITGAGGCGSMVTENTAAIWINEDCEENVQPFICRRADLSVIPSNCPSVAPKAGEDFFPPGFPNPNTICEYFLVVAANKLIELQIMTLVAEDNKDFLEILEGTSGPHPLANLTGTILTPTKYISAKFNVMRVNWKPSGKGSGRGFRIRYNEVSP